MGEIVGQRRRNSEEAVLKAVLLVLLLPGPFLPFALAFTLPFAFGALVSLVFILFAFSVLSGALLLLVGLVTLHHVFRKKFGVLFEGEEKERRMRRQKQRLP